MTCSSSTISRPDATRYRALGLLAMCGAGALALASPLVAAPGEDALAEAADALVRQDGVAAQMAGRRALEEGAPRDAVAAYVGEGELLQGDLASAREWLGGAQFDTASHDRGYLALAKLEIAAGDLAAASRAFDEILEHGTPDANVWVEIARMRYRAGEHQGALAAAQEGLKLDPHSAAALQFMAQITRDTHGPLAALPLFRQAIAQAPDDLQLAAQYAGTLGDAGQHAQMLAVVRAIVEKNPDQPQAFYLQAILAARAGDDDLARQLWWRTAGAFDETAVGLLVAGVLEYRSGNPAVATERFAQLSRQQPLNVAAQLLFARALVANGDANVAIPVLRPLAERDDASVYTLVLLARAYEQLGQRDAAAPLLDRAAGMTARLAAPVAALWLRDEAGRTRDPNDAVQHLRELMNNGRLPEAQAMVASAAQQFDGSVDLQMLAGDVALLQGDAGAALAQYAEVAKIRANWPLMQRLMALRLRGGDTAGARNLLTGYLRSNPRDGVAAAMLGRMQRDAGDPQRAVLLMRHAAGLGSGPFDPFLLGDLAEVEAATGQSQSAAERAQAAASLAPANTHLTALLRRLQGVVD